MKRKAIMAFLLVGIVIAAGTALYIQSHRDPQSNTYVVWQKGTMLIGKGNGSSQMGWANFTINRNMTLIGMWRGSGPGVLGDMLVAPLVTIGNETVPWIMGMINMSHSGTLNYTLNPGNFAVVYITIGAPIKVTQTVMLINN